MVNKKKGRYTTFQVMDTELKDHIDENIIHYCSLKQNPEYGIINQYFKEV